MSQASEHEMLTRRLELIDREIEELRALRVVVKNRLRHLESEPPLPLPPASDDETIRDYVDPTTGEWVNPTAEEILKREA